MRTDKHFSWARNACVFLTSRVTTTAIRDHKPGGRAINWMTGEAIIAQTLADRNCTKGDVPEDVRPVGEESIQDRLKQHSVASKKQPVSLLFVDQIVEKGHGFNTNFPEHVAQCIGKR